MTRLTRLGVLLSGTGRTLANLLRERDLGRLPIEPCCVISSHPGVPGLKHAKDGSVPTHVCHFQEHGDAAAYGAALWEILRLYELDLVAMAGFLHLWRIPRQLEHRVLNIHPALLPAFGGRGYYGARVHRAVYEAGVKVTGCTVHFADNEYDHGPIILQETVPVLGDDDPDSIAVKVFEAECRAYPEAIRLFAANRLRVEGRRVRVLPLRK